MKKASVVFLLAFILAICCASFGERQFFDDGIRCLELGNDCGESEGDFKNDETPPPPEYWDEPLEPPTLQCEGYDTA